MTTGDGVAAIPPRPEPYGPIIRSPRPDLPHGSRRLLSLGAVSLGLVLAAAALAWQALGTARPPGIGRLGPAATCLLAAACVGVLLAALMRQLDRFTRAEASLADRNGVLEATRRRMEAQAAELQASRALLAEQSAALETTLGHMDQGIMMVDADQTVVVCNDRAMGMLGLPRELMDAKPRFSEVVDYQASAGEFRLPGAMESAKYRLEPHRHGGADLRQGAPVRAGDGGPQHPPGPGRHGADVHRTSPNAAGRRRRCSTSPITTG